MYFWLEEGLWIVININRDARFDSGLLSGPDQQSCCPAVQAAPHAELQRLGGRVPGDRDAVPAVPGRRWAGEAAGAAPALCPQRSPVPELRRSVSPAPCPLCPAGHSGITYFPGEPSASPRACPAAAGPGCPSGPCTGGPGVIWKGRCRAEGAATGSRSGTAAVPEPRPCGHAGALPRARRRRSSVALERPGASLQVPVKHIQLAVRLVEHGARIGKHPQIHQSLVHILGQENDAHIKDDVLHQEGIVQDQHIDKEQAHVKHIGQHQQRMEGPGLHRIQTCGDRGGHAAVGAAGAAGTDPPGRRGGADGGCGAGSGAGLYAAAPVAAKGRISAEPNPDSGKRRAPQGRGAAGSVPSVPGGRGARRAGERPARVQRRCRSPAAGRRLFSGISSPATAVPPRLPPPPPAARKLCGRSPQARWELGSEHLPASPACAAGRCCPPAPRSPPRACPAARRRCLPAPRCCWRGAVVTGAGASAALAALRSRCGCPGAAGDSGRLRDPRLRAPACRAVPQPAACRAGQRGQVGLSLRPWKLFHDLCCDRGPPGAALRARPLSAAVQAFLCWPRFFLYQNRTEGGILNSVHFLYYLTNSSAFT